jgi:hypothetical protein
MLPVACMNEFAIYLIKSRVALEPLKKKNKEIDRINERKTEMSNVVS